MTDIKRFAVGNVVLYQGDSLAILEKLQSNSLGAVITDPPYASSGTSSLTNAQVPSKKYQNNDVKNKFPEFMGENRDQRSFAFWASLWVSQCYRLVKTGSPICVFSDWRQLPATTDYIQAGGFSFNGIIPWDKTESVRPAKGKFRCQAEYIAWGFKGKCYGDRHPVYLKGALRERVNPREKLHMTGKPVAVMDHLVQVVPPGETIIDPFMGSGSTGVAAIKAGHPFIGIEASPEYFEIAKKRLRATYRDSIRKA
ncbi:DNA-methyltransferase [Microbulbifer variabilis]|uniref:DNA-methyltransferase n=1 Tax=Microbulbifer variabilis TaxID=266805 RepID=UPI001CFF1FB0|nr:site-specific DNA-methyltransferase [Microbulbifer variabilis]